MKNKTFFDSICCAFSGLKEAFKTEKNYYYYFKIYCFFFVLNLVFGVPFIAYVIQIITTAGVFSSECLNTAVEHIMDFVEPDIKPEIKIIKDIASASVLCWGFAFFICEFMMIGRSI